MRKARWIIGICWLLLIWGCRQKISFKNDLVNDFWICPDFGMLTFYSDSLLSLSPIYPLQKPNQLNFTFEDQLLKIADGGFLCPIQSPSAPCPLQFELDKKQRHQLLLSPRNKASLELFNNLNLLFEKRSAVLPSKDWDSLIIELYVQSPKELSLYRKASLSSTGQLDIQNFPYQQSPTIKTTQLKGSNWQELASEIRQIASPYFKLQQLNHQDASLIVVRLFRPSGYLEEEGIALPVYYPNLKRFVEQGFSS